MPRNISFFYTTDQIINQTKDVTRRDGWLFLKPGDILNACEKCQGLGKGGKINKLCQIEVISASREPLNKITKQECIREGFPEMEPEDFVEMFCRTHKNVWPEKVITRIEFKYL